MSSVEELDDLAGHGALAGVSLSVLALNPICERYDIAHGLAAPIAAPVETAIAGIFE